MSFWWHKKAVLLIVRKKWVIIKSHYGTDNTHATAYSFITAEFTRQKNKQTDKQTKKSVDWGAGMQLSGRALASMHEGLGLVPSLCVCVCLSVYLPLSLLHTHLTKAMGFLYFNSLHLEWCSSQCCLCWFPKYSLHVIS